MGLGLGRFGGLGFLFGVSGLEFGALAGVRGFRLIVWGSLLGFRGLKGQSLGFRLSFGAASFGT